MKAYKIILFTGLVFISMAVNQIVFSCVLYAQPNFSIPSLTAKPGDTLSIPVEMTGLPTDSSIFSIQFEITYDPVIITVDSVVFDTSLSVISGWKKEFNLTVGRISCALAGADFVPTDIVIANLTLIVSEFAVNGDSSGLHFENLYVNEGIPTASGRDGAVKIIILGVVEQLDGSIPKSPSIEQNFPNPFNPMTTIEFSIPQAGEVSLIIYNVNGREVERLIDGEMSTGRFAVVWNAEELVSGIYFYRLQLRQTDVGHARAFVRTRKMVLLK